MNFSHEESYLNTGWKTLGCCRYLGGKTVLVELEITCPLKNLKMKTDYFALDSYWPLTSKMTLLSLCCSYDCYSERIILTLIVRPIFLFLRGRRQRSDEDILEIFDVGYLKISQEDNGRSFILIWTLNCLLVSLINDLKILKLELTLVDLLITLDTYANNWCSDDEALEKRLLGRSQYKWGRYVMNPVLR